MDKGYEFEVQKGTLDIKYPQKNHTKYSSLQSSNLALVKALTPLYLLGSLWGISPGARFSKVLIINGPGKLSPFTLKIEVSIVLHIT